MYAIGPYIAEARKKKQLTQSQISERCDISRPYLSDLEHGKFNPSWRILSALATELDLDLNYMARMSEIQYKDETA